MQAAPVVAQLDDGYADLLEHMGWDPIGVDGLVERSGLTPEVVSSMLLRLELEGHVQAVGGGVYARRAP
jgi:DNA processing protein